MHGFLRTLILVLIVIMVVVAIAQGKLKGVETATSNGTKFYEFLSIPYAKPPVGDLRFKSPQSVEPWHGVKDVTVSQSTNTSYQPDFFLNEKPKGSEDCLYLNVYTPKIEVSDPLPVLFYIHGGGFVYGNGLKEDLGPEYLIEHNAVVVIINYRLGIFGFLNLGIPEVSGNMGLKDQVKALEWVQQNITRFGGDKDNVTIFGTSAGSASVDYLLLSPKAKGLFHKAVLHSGVSLNDWSINFQYNELTTQVLHNLNYKDDATDKHKIYEFLLKVPAEDLVTAGMRATETLNTKAVYFGFVPSIEKDFGDAFLTTHPYKIIKEGSFNKVPVIKGFCEKEGFITYILKPDALKELVAERNFTKFFAFNFESHDVEKFNNLFSQAYFSKVVNAEDAAVDFFGDLHFTAGIWISAKFSAKHKVPTYVFEFLYDGNFNAKKRFNLTKKGAGHADDGLYLFTTTLFSATPNDTDLLVRDRYTKMWADFARTGNPATPEFAKLWSKFTEDNNVYLKIDEEFEVESNYQPERMAIFEEIYEKYEK